MADDVRIVCSVEPALDVDEFRRVLVESGLGATRPVDDRPRLQAMLSAAGLVLAARRDEPGRALVGVARGVTDFAWCCYIAELAVCASAQRLGVGRALLDAARQHLGPQVSIVLHSMPDAAAFYERIGMGRVEHAFWYRRQR